MKTIIVISIICGSIILVSGFLILAVHDYNINLLENGIVKEKILKKGKEKEDKLIKSKESFTSSRGAYYFLQINDKNKTTIFIVENSYKNEIRIDYNFSGDFLEIPNRWKDE